MSDLIVGIGLVFVIEGSLYALFPEAMRRVLESVARTPAEALRTTGAASVAVGVALVWLMRG